MAYRQLEISFWQDTFVMDLTPEEKYFYIYLMTNSKSTQCGVYCLPTRLIEAETGYNRETVEKLLKRFVDYEKILYSSETKEIMILNWVKYNFNNSINTQKCMNKELHQIRNKDFIDRLFNIFKEHGYNCEVVFEGLLRGLEGATKQVGETINKKQETKNIKQETENNKDDLKGHDEPDSTKKENEDDKRKKVPYAEIIELYNSHCISLPKVMKKPSSRLRAIEIAWNKLKSLDSIRDIFIAAQNSKFLTGHNDRGWKADFDWILQEKHYTKILEGCYNFNNTPITHNSNGTKSTFNNYSQRSYDGSDGSMSFGEIERKLLGWDD
jgi:hypothetical protein